MKAKSLGSAVLPRSVFSGERAARPRPLRRRAQPSLPDVNDWEPQEQSISDVHESASARKQRERNCRAHCPDPWRTSERCGTGARNYLVLINCEPESTE